MGLRRGGGSVEGSVSTPIKFRQREGEDRGGAQVRYPQKRFAREKRGVDAGQSPE